MTMIYALEKEHRLIERIIPLMKLEVRKYENNEETDARFLERAVDFFVTFTDRTHHGKEEGILFKALRKKEVSPDMWRVTDELAEEHGIFRNAVKALGDSLKPAPGTDVLNVRIVNMNTLIQCYPEHIMKEESRLFHQCLEYFSAEERGRMAEEFRVFDGVKVHEIYRNLMESMEKENNMGA